MRVPLICSFIVMMSFTVFAQSTIFLVPSTDTVENAHTHLEVEFASHLDSYDHHGFQTYGLRFNRGISNKLEVGANVFGTKDYYGTSVEIEPNIKYKAFQNEKHKIAVSTGATLYIPLDKSAGKDTTAMVYAVGSKEFNALKGFRLTGGGYTMVGKKDTVGTRTGVIAGFEKSVNKRFAISADWASGKSRVGYSSAGFSLKTRKHQKLYLGYKFGNYGRGHNGLIAFYGLSF